MLSKRIRAIDAARGTAMLFVFLSHFAEVYLQRTGALAAMNWSYRISMVASPTFMIISGVMLGFLYETHKGDFGGVRAKYLLRGLFLLTIGHVLIVIAHISFSGGVIGALRWGFITDTIGICMVFAPLLIERVKPKERVIIALVVYTLSTFAALLWHPQHLVLRFFKDILFGETYARGVHAEFFAVLPWFGLYFMSTCLGQKVGTYHLEKSEAQMRNCVLRTALLSLALFVILGVGLKLLVHWSVFPRFNGLLSTLSSPFYKRPPLPLFFLFFGGIGLLIMFSLMKYGDRNLVMRSYTKVAAMSGRTSMFVFIVQYYVYFTFFSEANLKSTAFWPLYFIASVALILVAARLWDKKKLNRLLSVPYSNRLIQPQPATDQSRSR